MSPTPRTDAAVKVTIGAGFNAVCPNFARTLETELARLRADLERFTGHGLLDCHAICDQRDAAVAERDQLRAEVERLKKDNLDMCHWIGSKMYEPEWDSFKKSLEIIDHWKARVKKTEAALDVMTTELGKMFLSAAERADRNVELRFRAQKAEVALQKIKDVMREDSNGKDPMDAVEDIITAAMEEDRK
jgi:cysteinyl-tRNA synthetase